MNYEKMKLIDIKKIAEDYDLPTNTTKEIMIKNIRLVEQDKFIYETTCEKFGKDEYLVGVDIKNQQKLIACGKYVDGGEMKKSHLYSSGRIYFVSSFKYL